MNDSMIEQGPKPIEPLPSANALSGSADITVSNRFKKLIPERGRQVAKIVKKSVGRTALTAPILSLIIFSGCGNTETQPQITPEPTSISAPNLPPTPTEIHISTSTIPISEPTPISTSTSIPKPDATSTPIPPKSTEDTKPPTESPKTTEYHYMDVSDNIKVAIDKEGLPVKYIFLSTNEEVYFDKGEIKKLREKAISSKEPEIIKMFLQENPASVAGFTYKETEAAQHPKTLELPKDVVSEKELEMKGITILQPENTNLSIRKGAFAKGGILEDFNNEGRKLIIIFLNGSVISPKYLNDPKYADIIDYLPKEFLSARDRRESKIAHAERALEFFSQELPAYLVADEYLHESVFLRLKSDIYKFKTKNFMTDDQVAKISDIPPGWYKDEHVFMIGQNKKSPSLVFLSVGQKDYSFPTLFFRHNGSISVKDLKFDYPGKLFPATTQTYPDPDDFMMNPYASAENKNYIYPGNVNPGFVLRHELAHRALIEERMRRGEESDPSEYSADKHAMQGIKEAWDKWVQSGYTDNAGYPFVFSLPKEQGGGYILTRKKKTAAKT